MKHQLNTEKKERRRMCWHRQAHQRKKLPTTLAHMKQRTWKSPEGVAYAASPLSLLRFQAFSPPPFTSRHRSDGGGGVSEYFSGRI